MSDRAKALLHPIRIRIAQVLASRAGLTTRDLAAALPDVPQASLYRHLRVLLDAEVVDVVDETRRRGAVERRYALNEERTVLDAEELAAVTPAEHGAMFASFIGSLLGTMERYLADDPDVIQDSVRYFGLPLWLDDAEAQALADELLAVVRRHRAIGPGPGRRLRQVGVVSLVATDVPPEP